MFQPVTLGISWNDLLGKTAEDMTDQERRDRFEQWLEVSKANDDEDWSWREYWADVSGCLDEETGEACHCLDGYWCLYMGLPCTVNPYLTRKHGMIGMACMGMRPAKNEVLQTTMW